MSIPLSAAPAASEEDGVVLMRRVAAGEEAALRQLIARWQRPLYNYFMRSLSDSALAEDLTQTVFLRLYRAAGSYVPRAAFSTYLFHIARGLLINALRGRRRKPLESRDPATLPEPADAPASQRAEVEECFALALADLPEKHRTALLLFHQQELSCAEIATAMQTSESVVKSWMHRGRKALRLTLKDML